MLPVCAYDTRVKGHEVNGGRGLTGGANLRLAPPGGVCFLPARPRVRRAFCQPNLPVKLLLCLLLGVPLSAVALIEPKKRLLIDEVLELTQVRAHVETLRLQNVQAVKAALVQEAGDSANSTYTRLALERMTAKYDEHSKLQFSWYRVEEKYLAFYDRAFTEGQLKSLVTFLKSDAGKILISSEPELAGILQQQIAATAVETRTAVVALFQQAQAEVDEQMREDAVKLINAPIDEVEGMARAGNSSAQYLMGTYLADGDRMAKNPAEAVKWLKLAVAQKHAGAEARLGWCYLLGEGVEKDVVRARELFTRAAEVGNTVGEYGLGLIYVRGEGVEKDTKRAFPLFLKAATAGHSGAQYEVAVLYWNGAGVERNLSEAYAWILVAEDSGGKEATEFHEFMNPRLSRDDVADGMMRSAEIRRGIRGVTPPEPE